MRFRRLGSSGLAVSVLGLGCNNFGGRIDAAAAQKVVDAALEAGITFFDTADIYGSSGGESEEALGAALGRRRDEVVLATKFGSRLRDGSNGPDWDARGSRRYVRLAVEASLRRLGTDWIDLYQLHNPDRLTPIGETLSVLDDLVHEGKIRYAGSSNFAGWEVADAGWTARHGRLQPFVSAQNEYSLLQRGAEAELVPACLRFGVGLIPYFPLASGLLTGKYRRGEPAPAGSRLASWPAAPLETAPWERVDAIGSFAASRGVGILDVAIGGLAAMQAVATVIAGATTPEQVQANVKASDWEPSAADLAELDSVSSDR